MSNQYGFGFDGGGGFSGFSGKKGTYKRCYHDHPALKIGDYEIYGGSCSRPIVNDADIYVGLDQGMHFSAKNYPWHKDQTVEFLYAITDMSAPSDPTEFKRMIEYLAEMLEAGKKIHVGCIGGHGRTGTVLAALVSHMLGEKNATTYVREHYCKKAVESKSQIMFLQKHFDIKPVKPTKSYSSSPWSTGSGAGSTRKSDDFYAVRDAKEKAKVARASKEKYVITPMETNDIWGTYLD